MVVCPSCGELTRVNIIRTEDEVQRKCKKCQALFD